MNVQVCVCAYMCENLQGTSKSLKVTAEHQISKVTAIMKKNPDSPSNFVSSLALYSVLLRESSTPYPDRRTLLSAGSCCYTHTTISMCTLKISPPTRVHPHIHTQICSLPCSPPVWHKLYRTKEVMDMIMIIFFALQL